VGHGETVDSSKSSWPLKKTSALPWQVIGWSGFSHISNMVQQVPTRSVQESIHSNSTSLNSIQQATFHPSFHPSFHQTFRKFPVLRMELHTLELPGLQDRRFAIFWWLRCTNECYENYETQAQPNARTTQNYTDILGNIWVCESKLGKVLCDLCARIGWLPVWHSFYFLLRILKPPNP